MELTQPPEMTTALTDLVLGVFALFLAWRLRRYHRRDETGVAVWLWFFTLLGLTALGGVPAHGLKCFAEPGPAQYIYWMPYSLLPGVTVSVFVVGVIHHWKGAGYVRAATYVMLPVCALFFVAMIVLSKGMEDYFLIFIVFESTCMLFALMDDPEMPIMIEEPDRCISKILQSGVAKGQHLLLAIDIISTQQINVRQRA